MMVQKPKRKKKHPDVSVLADVHSLQASESTIVGLLFINIKQPLKAEKQTVVLNKSSSDKEDEWCSDILATDTE